MIPVLVESAMRSLIVAGLVWAGLRVFGVRNVVAQKAAWGMVLGLALAMPLLVPVTDNWQLLPKQEGIVLPANPQTLLEELQTKIQAKNTPAPAALVQPDSVAASESSSTDRARAPQPALIPDESDAPQVADSPGSLPDSSPSQNVAVAPGPKSDAMTQDAAAPKAAQRPAISFAGVAVLVYLAVTAVFFIRLVYGLIAAVRLWHTATPICDRASSSAPLPRGVRSSSRVASPITVGSSVVLPADFMRWESEKLRVVLAHERSHVRQGDFYLQLFAGAYAAMFWFSPLGWWIKRRLSELAEAISDRAGLEQATSRSSYARLLLEFAATPRPVPAGVAMARSSNLSRRIEQFLNDRAFQQSFAGSRRTLVALLLVPVAFLVATALVRVQAAGQTQQPAPDPQAQAAPVAQPAPTEGVSNPEPVGNIQEAPQAPAPPAAPAAAQAPVAPQSPATPPAPTAPGEAVAPQAAPAVPPAPPALSEEPVPSQDVHVPPIDVHVPDTYVQVPGTDVYVPARDIHVPATDVYSPAKDIHIPAIDMHVPANDIRVPAIDVYAPAKDIHIPAVDLNVQEMNRRARLAMAMALADQSIGGQNDNQSANHNGWSHSSYFNNDDYYAVITGNWDNLKCCGWMEDRRDKFEKARKMAHGDFLWFRRDGKDYYIDDPGILAQIKADQQRLMAFGKEQAELDRRQEELGKQQEEFGRQQEHVTIPPADFSREIAELKKELDELQANGGKLATGDQLSEFQANLAAMQARLGSMQGELVAKHGDFGAGMSELDRLQGDLGAQQGRFGAEQGRLARQADRKLKSIIDESLKNGKAHPIN